MTVVEGDSKVPFSLTTEFLEIELFLTWNCVLSQLAGVAEYTDYITAEG